MSKYNEDILNHYGIEKATKQASQLPAIPDPRRQPYKKFLSGMERHLYEIKSCIQRLEEAARQAAETMALRSEVVVTPNAREAEKSYKALQKTMQQMYKLYQKAQNQMYDAENL